MEYRWLYKIKYSDPQKFDEEYKKRINSLSAYRYDFSVCGFPVFVVVNTKILQLITEIQSLDKEISKKEVSIPPVAYDQFVQKCLIDEVLQTVEMEGVSSSRQEIKGILDNKPQKGARLTGITKKYERLANGETIPLSSCHDIRQLYDEILLEEVRENNIKNIPDGEFFRKDIVYVTNDRGEIIHSGVVPETAVIQEMTSLLAALKNPVYNHFINIAVAHYMMGYIHPFYDGNGRISRFISSYLLSCRLEKIVGYRLAYTIKKDLPKYYKMFKLTNDKNNRGDLTPFTIYFLELISDSLKELLAYFSEQIEKLSFYEERIKRLNLSKDCRELLYVLVQNALFAYEGLTIPQLSDIAKKSDSHIRSQIKTLNEMGLLDIEKKRSYLYSAKLDAFS